MDQLRTWDNLGPGSTHQQVDTCFRPPRHCSQRPQDLAPHIRRLSIILGQCLTHQCVTINPRHASVGWHQLRTQGTGNCQKAVIPTSSLILALGSTAPLTSTLRTSSQGRATRTKSRTRVMQPVCQDSALLSSNLCTRQVLATNRAGGQPCLPVCPH